MGMMPGCSSLPVISASRTNRARLPRSSAYRSLISLKATSRSSSSSSATETTPSPPLACGRTTRNRPFQEVGSPSELGGAGLGSGRPTGRPSRGLQVADAGLEVGVGELAEVVGHRADRAEGLQAPGGVAAVGADVLVDEGFEQVPARLRQVAPLDEQGPQRRLLADDPGVHRLEEGVAGDEIHLLGQDAQQQVAVGVNAGHRGQSSMERSDQTALWSSSAKVTRVARHCGDFRFGKHRTGSRTPLPLSIENESIQISLASRSWGWDISLEVGDVLR